MKHTKARPHHVTTRKVHHVTHHVVHHRKATFLSQLRHVKPHQWAVLGVLVAVLIGIVLFPILPFPAQADNPIFKSDYIDCPIYFTNCNNEFAIPNNLQVTSAEVSVVNGTGTPYAITGVSLYGRPSFTNLGSSADTQVSLHGNSDFHFPNTSFNSADYSGGIVVAVYAASRPENTKIRLTLYGNVIK